MMKTRELSLLPPICTRLKHSKSHENYLGFSRIIVNSIYLVCRREGRRKCLWHRLCFSFRLSRCSLLRQFFPPLHKTRAKPESSRAIKINIVSLFGSLSWLITLLPMALTLTSGSWLRTAWCVSLDCRERFSTCL